MLKLKTLAAQITNANEAVRKWNETATAGLMVEYRGQMKQALSEELVELFDELFTSASVSNVEDSAKAIVLALDDFEDQQNEWAEACQIDPEFTDPSGNREMWAAWDEVLEQLRIALTPLPQPEPIKTLKIEKVGDRQICDIYGWLDSHGNPELHKVREETEKPGTHYDPATWVHPSAKRRMAETSRRWSKRNRATKEDYAPRASIEAPESLEDLIRQGVPSKQIAMMKRVAVEDVRAVAEAIGVPLDGQYVPTRNPIDQLQRMRDDEADRKAEAQQAMNGTKPKTVSERVSELVDAGATPEVIAESLLAEFPKVKPAQLQKLIESALQSTGI